MAQSHLIALPTQELSALLCAVNAPQFASLFAQTPAFRAALQAPVEDSILELAQATQDAIRQVARNTQYPEDWDAVRDLASRLSQQKQAQDAAQASGPTRNKAKRYGNKVCTCCGGERIASVYSKACNSNYFSIPHMDFEVHGYMPRVMGIPGSGDGPELEVCLDCGRVVNEEYPITDEMLKQRIAEYQEDLL